MISSNNEVPIIVSLVGSVEDDFDFMVKQFENCKVSAYELNLSCPHVAKVGLEVGDDVELESGDISSNDLGAENVVAELNMLEDPADMISKSKGILRFAFILSFD